MYMCMCVRVCVRVCVCIYVDIDMYCARRETTRVAGIAMYVMWECNPVAMAAKLDIREPDRYKALLHVLAALREGRLVEVFGAEHVYVHRLILYHTLSEILSKWRNSERRRGRAPDG